MEHTDRQDPIPDHLPPGMNYAQAVMLGLVLTPEMKALRMALDHRAVRERRPLSRYFGP